MTTQDYNRYEEFKSIIEDNKEYILEDAAAVPTRTIAEWEWLSIESIDTEMSAEEKQELHDFLYKYYNVPSNLYFGVEAALSAYDNGTEYSIVKSIDLTNDAKLVSFVSEDGMAESSAVVYNDGTVFVTDDWQGGYAESFEEIEDFEWYTLGGQRAIIMDGLPKILL